MAVLNKIRQRSIFLIIVIALALFSFVIGDIFTNLGSSSVADSAIATINGVDVERNEFMNKVENIQRQSNGSTTNTQAMNRAWDNEVRAKVMQSQYDALGLSVERDYMRNLLEQNLGSFEEFKNEVGLFDQEKLNEFIANLKAIDPETTTLGGSVIDYKSWTNFEQNVAISGVQQAYFNMVKSGITGTLTEGELDYQLENDKVDLKYVQIPYSSVADSTISVMTSEIDLDSLSFFFIALPIALRRFIRYLSVLSFLPSLLTSPSSLPTGSSPSFLGEGFLPIAAS